MHPDYDTNDSLNPELPELLQRDQDRYPAVDVRTIGAVRTQEMPATSSYSRYVQLTNNPDTMEIVPADPRRKYITIVVTAAIFIGHDKLSVVQGTAGRLPANRDVTLYTTAPIYMRSDGAGPVDVGYWVGSWAD